ncbi:MAG: hypothetical protein ACRDA3_09425 [Peptostreptococcaceae bacterium]
MVFYYDFETGNCNAFELIEKVRDMTDTINGWIDDFSNKGFKTEFCDGRYIDGVSMSYVKDKTNEYLQLDLKENGDFVYRERKNGSIEKHAVVLGRNQYVRFYTTVRNMHVGMHYSIRIVVLNQGMDDIIDGIIFGCTIDGYKDYLKTIHWDDMRKYKLKEANYKCQLCGVKETELHVHHNNYDNLGDECPSDLIVLCKDCHSKFHNK